MRVVSRGRGKGGIMMFLFGVMVEVGRWCIRIRKWIRELSVVHQIHKWLLLRRDGAANCAVLL